MKTLLENMKAALTGDRTLSGYLGDAVYIQPWDPAKLPDFDRYCVVLSDAGTGEDKAGVQANDLVFFVLIVCLVRNFGMPETLVGGQGNTGLYKFVDDLKNCLRGNPLDGAVMPDNGVFSGRSEQAPFIPDNVHILAAKIGYSARRRIIVTT